MTIRIISSGETVKCSEKHGHYMIANGYAHAVKERAARKTEPAPEEKVTADGA